MTAPQPPLILGLSRPNFLRVVIYPVACLVAGTLLYLRFVRQTAPSDGQVIRSAESFMGMNAKQSIAELRALLAREPRHARAWVALGRALESRWGKRDNWRARIAHFERILADKRLPRELRQNHERNLAFARKVVRRIEQQHDERTDRQQALAAYRRALELSQDPGIGLLVCQTHVQQRRLAQAHELIERVRRSKGGPPDHVAERELTHGRILALLAEQAADPAAAGALRERAIARLTEGAALCERQLAGSPEEQQKLQFTAYLAETCHDLGQLYWRQEKLEPAEQRLRRAVELQRKAQRKMEYAQSLGRLLTRRGRHVEALEQHRLAARRQAADAWFDLATAQLRLWSKVQALDSLGLAVQHQPQAVREWLTRDRASWSRLDGDPQFERVTGFDSALGPFLGRQAARLSARLIEPTTEIDELPALKDEVLRLAADLPGHPLPALLRGQLLLRAGRELARTERRRAADEARRKGATKAQQVQLEARLEALAQRRDKLLALLGGKPAGPAAQQAAAAFEQALALRRDRRMLAAVAEAHLILGRPEDALRFGREALALAQGRWQKINLLALIGYAHQRQGRPEQSLELYRQALALDPANGALHSAVAELELELGRPRQAEAAYRAALAAIEAPVYQLGLGRALLAQQRYPEARRSIEAYAARHPRDFRTLYYLGQLDQIEGREQAAVKRFRELLDRDPRELGRRVRLHAAFWRSVAGRPGYADLLAEAAELAPVRDDNK